MGLIPGENWTDVLTPKQYRELIKLLGEQIERMELDGQVATAKAFVTILKKLKSQANNPISCDAKKC